MSLLPDRHPQKDFFILDIADVVPKDDTASMEHPLFSLATKPDMHEHTTNSDCLTWFNTTLPLQPNTFIRHGIYAGVQG